jgi:probable metal-binding protein
MSESIHGHEVMEMMIASKQSFTKESLERAIISKFGKDARFHTCSADNMTAGELINFLESRGKFNGTNEGFVTDPDKICNH